MDVMSLADGDLRKLDRTGVWAFGAGMGVMVLGLDEGRNHWNDSGGTRRVDPVHGDTEIPQALVVLFLAEPPCP